MKPTKLDTSDPIQKDFQRNDTNHIRKDFCVSHWGSHPDANNDDCLLLKVLTSALMLRKMTEWFDLCSMRAETWCASTRQNKLQEVYFLTADP